MADIPLQVQGDDSFVMGMDSYTQSSRLSNGEYISSMNTINRGGLIQTRPGSVSLFDLPKGNFQGCKFFIPKSGVPSIVSAVDGKLYVSSYPFKEYALIPNIQFAPSSKMIAWAVCIKFTDYDYSTGKITYLANPYSILIIQDGATRAAYWDGSASGHLNPTRSNSATPVAGVDETPVGLWMAWSGNRLWVSSGSQITASDIGNPLKFTETQYLNEGRAFYLSGTCTGIAETADRQGILCFTESSGTLLQSSIQDRTKWLQTPGFQQEVLPNVGCVAPRSIIQQYGLLWWFTAKGLISQDGALQTHITSRLDVRDNEMFQSKYNMAYDLSGVCGGNLENFLLHGVPVGHKDNTRVHVMDLAPFEGNANSFPSFWTGWIPVEFANGIVHGKERLFAASKDQDGVNRLWELFKAEKTDNGIPITSYVATRQHFFDNRDYKKFRYAEIELREILGDTALMVAVSGIGGAYQKIMEKDISALDGQVYYDEEYGYQSNDFAGSRGQNRIVKTNDDNNASECNSGCVESDIKGLIDKAFSLLIVWSGVAGISAYRMFAQGEPTRYDGTCEVNETGQDRLLNDQGCGFNSKFGYGDSFEEYFSKVKYTKDGVSKTIGRASIINKQDAYRKALTTAQWYVFSKLGQL